MRYRLTIFDFDGTLADSFPWVVRNLNGCADRHGFRRVDAEEIEALRGHSARQIMEHLAIPAWKVPKIALDMKTRMGQEIDQIRLFDGVEPALAALAGGGATLALLTSNSEPNARRVLGERSAGLMAHYSCGATVFGKQAKLRKLLRRFDVPREQVLCVGDEIRDIEAARAEGLPFGAVGWGYTRLDALVAEGPRETFRSPAELARLVVP